MTGARLHERVEEGERPGQALERRAAAAALHKVCARQRLQAKQPPHVAANALTAFGVTIYDALVLVLLLARRVLSSQSADFMALLYSKHVMHVMGFHPSSAACIAVKTLFWEARIWPTPAEARWSS